MTRDEIIATIKLQLQSKGLVLAKPTAQMASGQYIEPLAPDEYEREVRNIANNISQVLVLEEEAADEERAASALCATPA